MVQVDDMAPSGPSREDTEHERTRMALANAEADLQRHAAALAKLQGEFAASRLEVAGARGETVQYRGFLGQAEADVAAAFAHIEELRAHAAQRETEIGRLHAELVGVAAAHALLRAEIDGLRASLSWRMSAPIRVAGRLLRRGRPGQQA